MVDQAMSLKLAGFGVLEIYRGGRGSGVFLARLRVVEAVYVLRKEPDANHIAISIVEGRRRSVPFEVISNVECCPVWAWTVLNKNNIVRHWLQLLRCRGDRGSRARQSQHDRQSCS